MPGFLRYLGLLNAAVWVGGSVFFSFLAGPVFFTPEVKSITPPPYNGIVAQIMLGRYFSLHLLCGVLAIVHLLLEWLYGGGAFPRRAVAVIGVLLGLALIGGKFIGPKLTVWHQQQYQFQLKSEDGGPPMIKPKTYPQEVRQDAKWKFGIWHGVSQTVNLAMLILLAWRFWKLARPASSQAQTFVQTKRNLFSA